MERSEISEEERVSLQIELETAIIKGSPIEVIRGIILRGADVNWEGEDGTTPLMIACEENRLEIAKFLIENGADVNKCDKDESTSLSVVSFYNYIEIAKLLIEHGADVNKANSNGRSPLLISSMKGNDEIARILIENGADVNNKSTSGHSSLSFACFHGNVEVVKLLIMRGVYFDKYKNNPNHPLAIACGCAHFDIAKLLVEHGVDTSVYIYKIPIILYLAQSFTDAEPSERDEIGRLIHLLRFVNKLHGATYFPEYMDEMIENITGMRYDENQFKDSYFFREVDPYDLTLSYPSDMVEKRRHNFPGVAKAAGKFCGWVDKVPEGAECKIISYLDRYTYHNLLKAILAHHDQHEGDPEVMIYLAGEEGIQVDEG
ncbi:MAG: ankyrin repeat domain-containing protein [Rickettsiaceae bacterium]|nr:ankyrin repeat domain-containing protein [Rickettsiaceae bacterium]